MSLGTEFWDALKEGLHDSDDQFVKQVIPTGCPPIDRALGGMPDQGGFGTGRIHEIFGDWSTGKTAILYLWLISTQLRGGQAGLDEAEGGFEAEWYRSMGGVFEKGNPQSLRVNPECRTVEEFFDKRTTLVKKLKKVANPPLVAWGLDSIAALGTEKLEKEGLGGSRDMTKAFLMDQGTKRLIGHIYGLPIAFLGTNQTRKVVGAQPWEPTHTPGGRAWPYFSSTRIELKLDGGPKGHLILHDGEGIGRWVRGTVIKNKQAPPFRVFKVPIYNESGFPHPEFENELTLKGVDVDESLLEFYLGNKRATWGEDAQPYMQQAGPKVRLHAELFPDAATFYRREWKKVLEEYPHLRNYKPEDPIRPPKPKPTVKKKARKK